eukprot:Plantae.Rhodophyta-Purpureofilum_apyrenoidigerum.ctg12875.p2 GENE.Plantae.Rhodophyta-Purpureofilum_apyrenoidigerum.ctg12875~~Plantae.Rhodophyta-Purpureofilum_apyrenoidigerum.ctg12875.p2  ORF type:complete len:194 (+),score=54.23 Plantae.Rhodophyta-Purpureofilum_apyrenoidigerum.ctg12875:177-758(+)
MKREAKVEDEIDSDDEHLAKKAKKVQKRRAVAAGGKVEKKIVKVKTVKKEEGVVQTGVVSVKQEKRKFEKPGQRRETPPKSDPLRMFYESMYVEKQRKGVRSELAENWLVMYGVLETDAAAEIVDRRKSAKGGMLSLSQESSQIKSTKVAAAASANARALSKSRATAKLSKSSPKKKVKASFSAKACKVKARV